MSQVPEPGRYDGCLWCDRIICGRLGPRPRRPEPSDIPFNDFVERNFDMETVEANVEIANQQLEFLYSV